MEINKYKCSNHKEVISGLIASEGFLEGCSLNIMKHINNNDRVALKELIEGMWQQDINMVRIDKLICELNKGVFRDRLASWINFYEKYYRMGFTSYII